MNVKGTMTKIKIQITVLVVFSTMMTILPLNAGSRLGKVSGVMEEIIAINLGSIHGIRQGQSGKVFMFDENLKEVDVAFIQVIGVSEESCLARITELRDSLQIGQFVDIEGARPPQRLEKVDVPGRDGGKCPQLFFCQSVHRARQCQLPFSL